MVDDIRKVDRMEIKIADTPSQWFLIAFVCVCVCVIRPRKSAGIISPFNQQFSTFYTNRLLM